jgi:crotonobetainyl-CoA:carnitine CoA-transferase CaiB-like acyl-CoA transferase
MEGLAMTGFTIEEGASGPPRFPPTLVMNDYIAGYLGACGVIAALRRRAKEGGSYHVRVSLTRAAMWYASLGRFPDTNFDLSGPDNRMISPEIMVAQTPYGLVRRIGPQVKLSRTPGRWRDPLVAVRGGDPVAWER